MHQNGNASILWKFLGAASAIFGIISILIGGIGILSARRKREWLQQRLIGERIRQFHFQTLIFRLPEILLSLRDEKAKSEFLSHRKLWFETFVNHFENNLDAAFVEMIDEERTSDFCLHEGRKRNASAGQSQELDPVFEAYRELRILHQINHANYKLQNDYKLFSTMPRRQAQVLSHLILIAVIVLCVVDAGVLWQVFFPGSVWTVAAADWISVFTVCIALAALSVRAIEQGLQPEREAERYQQYRSAIRAILDRFDRAQTQAEKIPIMEEMERLCFDELRNFLTTNERARFVL